MYGRNNIFSSTNNNSNNNNSSYNNNTNYGNYNGNYGNNNSSGYNNYGNNSYGYNNNNNSNNRLGTYRVNNYKYDDPPSHLTNIIELWRQHQPTAITSREELLHLSPIQTRVQDYFLIRNRQLNASHEEKLRDAIRKDCFNQELIKNNCYNLMPFSREIPFSLDTIRALARRQNTSGYGYTSNNTYGNNNTYGSNSYGNNNSSTYNTRSNNSNNIFSNNNNSYGSNSGNNNNNTSNNIFTRNNSTNNNNSYGNNSSSNIFSNTNNNSNNNNNNIFSTNSTNNNNGYGSNTNNNIFSNNNNTNNNNGGNNIFNSRNNNSGNNNTFSNNNNGGGNNNIFSNNNSNGNNIFNNNNNNNGGNNNIFNNNNNNGNRNLFGNNNYNNGNNLFNNNNNNGNIFNNNNGNNLFNNTNRNGNIFDNNSNYNPYNQLGVDPRIFTQLHSMLKNASQYFRRTNGPLPHTQVPVSTPENNSLFGSYNNNPVDIFEIQTYAKKKRQDQEIILSVKKQPSMKSSRISNRASKQDVNHSQIMKNSQMGGTTRLNNYMQGTKNQRSMMSNNESFKESKIISNTESFWRKQPQQQKSRSIMNKSNISKQAHEDIRKSRLAVEQYYGECVCQFVLNIVWIDNDPKRCQVLPHQLNVTLKLKSLKFKQSDQRAKIVKLLKGQNQMVRYNAQLEILQCQKVKQEGAKFILRGKLHQRLFNLDPYEYQVFYLKIKQLYAFKTTIRNKYGDVCWQNPIDISTLDFQDSGEFSIANNEIICDKKQLNSKCMVTFRRLPDKIKGIIEKQGGDTQKAQKTLSDWVNKISQRKFQLHKMWVHPQTGEDGWSMNVQKFSD